MEVTPVSPQQDDIVRTAPVSRITGIPFRIPSSAGDDTA
jgi:hypothetical protein